MFENLTQRLETVFRRLRGRGVLSEQDVADAAREVRRALLEADVHFRVARDFIARVGERAVGQEVLRSISPGQQFVKVVNDELVALLGGEAAELRLDGPPPSVVMLVGLQDPARPRWQLSLLATSLSTAGGRSWSPAIGSAQRPSCSSRSLAVRSGFPCTSGVRKMIPWRSVARALRPQEQVAWTRCCSTRRAGCTWTRR